MRALNFCLGFAAALLAVPLAYAQAVTYLKVSAGTGFVINNNGNVVTNAHVVRNCQSINVLTAQGERKAKLIASDDPHDLAVLAVNDLNSPAIAPLRWNISNLKVSDAVEVIGFPGQEGINGHYSFKKTTVTSLEGPANEPLWIQLDSVAEHGNSGGPVLDTTGNVIGVLSGMAQTFRVAPDGSVEPGIVRQADVAITLLTLQDFLHQNGIEFYESASGLVAYADGAIEHNALKFILPVRCIQGRVAQQ